MPRVLMPLPAEGFEPTEAAVPWQHLRAADIEVTFATPDGAVARRRRAPRRRAGHARA